MHVVQSTRSDHSISIVAIACLVGLIVLSVCLSGCCAPCHGAAASHHHAQPRQFAEPQWPYLDRNGRSRYIGDSAFRDHLGLPNNVPVPIQQ